MPQAPAIDPRGLLPDVAPTTQGIQDVSLPVPVDAFGGAVGRALEGLGETISKSSDTIWARAMDMQNLQNETQAKDADAKYMMESGKMHADFINKEGLNAGPEALAKHIQDLQDLRTNIRSGLNPAAARMYDGSSMSFMGRNIFNAAGHSGQQMKVAAQNASQSRVDMLGNSVGDNPTDEVQAQRSIYAQKAEIAAQGKANGWSQDQIDATTQSTISTTWAKRIAGLSKTDAIGSQKMLDQAQKKGWLTPNDALRVQGTVTTQFNDQGSRVIADKVLADRRAGEDEDNKPAEDYVDAGMKEAEKLGLDPERLEMFKDRVRDRIVTKYKQQRAIETDSDNLNVRTIGKALIHSNEEGQFPTTIEELKSIDPAVGPAWDAIGRDPRKQQAVLKQLEHNAAGTNRVPTTPTNLMLTHQYVGMASGSDEERAQFASQNFATDNRLSLPQRNHLMTIQDMMKKNQFQDPRVARALSILKPDLDASGIGAKSGDPASRTDYLQFVGGLTDALQQFAKDNPNRPMPNLDEVHQIGGQLMKEQAGTGWFTNDKFYQVTAPDENKASIIADPFWKGRVPSDAEVNRFYRAQLYRDRYGKSGSGEPKVEKKTLGEPGA